MLLCKHCRASLQEASNKFSQVPTILQISKLLRGPEVNMVINPTIYSILFNPNTSLTTIDITSWISSKVVIR